MKLPLIFVFLIISVPVPMYVLGGTIEKHEKHYSGADDSGQLASNVTYLGLINLYLIFVSYYFVMKF